MLRFFSTPIRPLCLGNQGFIDHWVNHKPGSLLGFALPSIGLGFAAYGASLGIWHDWEMAGYVAIKFPTIIFLTLLFNGLINGLFALVLDSGIAFRHSMRYLLISFSIMALIMGSLAPITFCVAMQAPKPGDMVGHQWQHNQWHQMILIFHTVIIAYAGITSHAKLLRHLRRSTSSPNAATLTFFAWLAGNLFVGTQISWLLRPIFGTPGIEVEFLRQDMFNGTFYEAFYKTILNGLQ